jgi:hypothetical protein
MTPTRTATVSITVLSPGYDWKHAEKRVSIKKYNEAKALGATVTNDLYYRLHTPDTFGAPWAFSESWTYTEQIDSSNSMGDKTTNGITANLSAATESVTVNGRTFTCYNLSIKQGTKYIYEYWDANGVFPYAPVKIVDSVNFGSTQTSILYSSNVLP